MALSPHPADFRATVAEIAISDAAVAAACIGWASACFQLLQRRSVSGLSRFGVVGSSSFSRPSTHSSPK